MAAVDTCTGISGPMDIVDRLGGAVDTDAFEAYIAEFGPLAPPLLDRIDVVR